MSPPTTTAAVPSARPSAKEIGESIDDLDEDEAAALMTFASIGSGDFATGDWRDTVQTARERRTSTTPRYVLGREMLQDCLDDALSQLGRSREGGDAEEQPARDAPRRGCVRLRPR
jgi:hypothetical protein